MHFDLLWLQVSSNLHTLRRNHWRRLNPPDIHALLGIASYGPNRTNCHPCSIQCNGILYVGQKIVNAFNSPFQQSLMGDAKIWYKVIVNCVLLHKLSNKFREHHNNWACRSVYIETWWLDTASAKVVNETINNLWVGHGVNGSTQLGFLRYFWFIYSPILCAINAVPARHSNKNRIAVVAPTHARKENVEMSCASLYTMSDTTLRNFR